MIIGRGAESIIERQEDSVIKKRISKGYRIPEIDLSLRRFRTRREAKVIEKLSSKIKVPALILVDDIKMEIKMEYISGERLVDIFDTKFCSEIGKIVAKIHSLEIIHGDLTTSNMILHHGEIYLIDFGLSYFSKKYEDKAVDLHLLFQALESKHWQVYSQARKIIIESYSKSYSEASKVIDRLADVEKRGRNKH